MNRANAVWFDKVAARRLNKISLTRPVSCRISSKLLKLTSSKTQIPQVDKIYKGFTLVGAAACNYLIGRTASLVFLQVVTDRLTIANRCRPSEAGCFRQIERREREGVEGVGVGEKSSRLLETLVWRNLSIKKWPQKQFRQTGAKRSRYSIVFVCTNDRIPSTRVRLLPKKLAEHKLIM